MHETPSLYCLVRSCVLYVLSVERCGQLFVGFDSKEVVRVTRCLCYIRFDYKFVNKLTACSRLVDISVILAAGRHASESLSR